MGEEFNPYYKWLAIPLAEQPPHHYRLLGVTPFESSSDVIANAADQRMAFLRTFQSGPKSVLSQKLLNEIAAARLVLLDPKRKAPYDESLRAQLDAAQAVAQAAIPAPPPPPVAPPAIPTRLAPARDSFAPPAGPNELVPLNRDRQRPPAKRAAGKSPLMIGAAVVGLLAMVTMIALLASGGGSSSIVALDDPSRHTSSRQSPPLTGDTDSPLANSSAGHAARIEPGPIETASVPPTETGAESEPDRSTAALPEPETPTLEPEPSKPTRPAIEPANPANAKPKILIPSVLPEPEPAPEPTTSPAMSEAETDTQPASPAMTRLIEPSADALAAASAQIKEVFRQELFAAASPGAKRMLAEKFLKQADAAQDDPPVRFGLYQQALHLATEAVDVALVLESIDSLAAAFQVDPHALRLLALQQMSRTAKSADQPAIGRAALEQIQSATQADELAGAEKLALLAQAVAIKIRDVEMRKVATARLADIKKVEQLWKEARPAAAVLENDPSDKAANLTYGSYLCLTHGDWAQGLPLLAKGGEGKLSAAARLDLQPAGDAAAQVQVGDAWWHLANEEKGFAKSLLLERAGHWYAQAAPRLVGLTQTRIEKRLQEIANHAHEEPLGRRPPAVPASKMLDVPLAAGDANASTTLHLRWLPAGKFMQGSPPKEPGHQPFETLHEVVLTRPFFIGTTEVTQAQWQAVMGTNPSNFKGPDIPVHNVTFTAAKEFCERLDQLPGVRGKYQFRLPTSAEWEYACRAGSYATYCYGDDPAKLGEYAWYRVTTQGVGGPRSVAQLKPNAAGLYDMHGNVNEWCTDSFSNLILTTRQVDPKGFAGVNQVTRGGHGMSSAEECRSAHIFNDPPGKSVDALGFRVVCESTTGKK